MPSAPHLHDAIISRYGSIDTTGPEEYLLSRGYTITGGGVIHPPPGTETVAEEERCIDFLVFEWDYGFDPTPIPSPRPQP